MQITSGDLLRVIRFDDAEVTLLRKVITATWARGIQKEGLKNGCYEFKMKGNPFLGVRDEVVKGSRLVCAVLEGLYHQGWTMELSTDAVRSSVSLLTAFAHSLISASSMIIAFTSCVVRSTETRYASGSTPLHRLLRSSAL